VVGLEMVASASKRIYRWRAREAEAEAESTEEGGVVVLVVVEASPAETCSVAALGHPRRRAASRFF
jgi:hypothetical protein